jgi:soluble lytic murein transglycosylase-like protein
MRLTTLLLAIACLGVVSGAAQAQDVTMMSVDATKASAPRSPALVVYEPAKSAPNTAPSEAANSVATNSKGLSTLKDATTKALNPNAATSPGAIFIPNGTQPSVEVFAAGAETTGNPVYDKLVHQSAARHGVDPNLVFAVMRQESGFKTRAISHKGASGLMQLMPGTARRFGVTNIFDPAQNIDAGTRYLRLLLDMFNGDVKLALAGYNAGEYAVVNSGYQIPRYRETQNYVKSISARYSRNKHTSAAKPKQSGPPQPAAPQAITTSKGRLSNNY